MGSFCRRWSRNDGLGAQSGPRGTATAATTDETGGDDDQATTLQHTTIRISNIDTGQIVFAHSVDTRVHSQANRAGRKIVAPTQFWHLGKQTAARACVAALQEALNGTR